MTKPLVGIRFSPPQTGAPGPLRWVLVRALGPLEAVAPLASSERRAALDFAERTGLVERISVRCSGELVVRELGSEGGERLRAVRRRTAIREIRLDEALQAAAEAARELGVEMAVLKGRALALAGHTAEGGRRSVDVDLLAPESRLAELQRHLLARGFRDPGGASYEHQAPPLVHSGGGVVELHRMVLGVRILDGRSARFEDLLASGELEPTEASHALAGLGLHIPSKRFLTAHALAHAIAQHGLAAEGPGFVMVADLIDLGWGTRRGAEEAGWLQTWLARDVSGREIEAALELARHCISAVDPIDQGLSEDALALLRHFTACVTEPVYAAALKGRLFERPLSDRSRARARIELAWKSLVPGRLALGGGETEPWAAYLRRLLRRPVELGRRWRLARGQVRALGGDPAEPPVISEDEVP